MESFVTSSSPIVGVLATSEADRLARKNGGLDVADLLRPFGAASSTRLPFRSVGRNYNLVDFRVEFVRCSEMQPAPLATSERLLAQALTPQALEARECHGAASAAAPGEGGGAAPRGGGGRAAPWQRRFRGVLARSLRCHEHALLECPATLLLVAASSDADPAAALAELSSGAHLPPPYQRGLYDPKGMAVFFVVLHDNCEGEASALDPTPILRRVQAAHPPQQCKLVRLNSLPASAPDTAQPDIWAPTLAPLFFPEAARKDETDAAAAVRGCCLSGDDLLALREFVLDIVGKGVVWTMERRLYMLNNAVTEKRKGVKNYLKQAFWRRPKDGESGGGGDGGRRMSASAASAEPVKYKHDTTEAQIRLLADTAFVMQDFETALANYRTAAADFKADKSYGHYGGCCEMMAVCGSLLDSDAGARANRDVRESLDAAYAAYARRAEEDAVSARRRRPSADGAAAGNPPPSPAGPDGAGVSVATRLATHAALLAADASTANEANPRHLEAVDGITKAAANETALVGAALYEMAAWTYLAAALPRKFALHASMAAHKYHMCGQELHSVRCYLAAMSVYDRGRWTRVRDHVHFTLGRQLYALGRPGVALRFYARLASEGKQSADRQATYLSELVYICRSAGLAKLLADGRGEAAAASEAGANGELEVVGLKVPAIDDALVAVLESGNADAASEPPDAAAPLWAELACELAAEERAGGAPETDARKVEAAVKRSVAAVSAAVADLRRDTAPSSLRAAAAAVAAAAAARTARPVGEPVVVRVPLANPLSIAVNLSHVQLIVRCGDGGDGDGGGGGGGGGGESERERSAGPGPAAARTYDPSDAALERAAFDAALSAPPATAGGGASYLLDKASVALGPNETRHVTLRALPLRSGETLHIVGIRWKLSDAVWVSHAISKVGPLLHKTRQDCARRTRGPDRTLTVVVGPQRPWLAATLGGVGAATLHGEVRAATLRLTNRGRAPAANVRVKCDGAWLAVCAPADRARHARQAAAAAAGEGGAGASASASAGEVDLLGLGAAEAGAVGADSDADAAPASLDAAVHGAVGCSGTAWALEGLELAPGASVAVPIWARAQGGGGSQALRLVVAYGAPGDAADAAKPKPRHVALAHEVCVLPALAARARVAHAAAKDAERVLTLSVESNVAAAADKGGGAEAVALASVCAVGAAWSFAPAVAGMHAGVAPLGSGDKATFHYGVLPRPPADGVSSAWRVGEEGAAAEGGAAANAPLPAPALQLLCVERTAAHYRRQRRDLERAELESVMGQTGPRSIGAIRRAAGHGDDGAADAAGAGAGDGAPRHPVSMRTLCDRLGSGHVTLVLLWTAAGGKRGQLHVPRAQICAPLRAAAGGKEAAAAAAGKAGGPPRLERRSSLALEVEASVASAPPPFALALEYPEVVRHDFSSGAGAEAAVTASVRRAAAGVAPPVAATLVALDDDGAAGDMCWRGATRKTEAALAGGADVALALTACFPAPGVYDLNRFRLEVTKEGLGDVVLGFTEQQELVTVLAV